MALDLHTSRVIMCKEYGLEAWAKRAGGPIGLGIQSRRAEVGVPFLLPWRKNSNVNVRRRHG